MKECIATSADYCIKIVAYPLMLEYASLALEDNSEVDEAAELGRWSVSCVCTSAF